MPSFSDARVGRVYMSNTTMAPGPQVYNAVMHLGEAATSAEAVGNILTSYLTGVVVPLTITGTSQSTKIAPLVPALSALKLSSPVTGINAGLIQHIKVSGSVLEMSMPPNLATADITLYNPLDTPFKIVSIKASTTKIADCAATAGKFLGQVVEVGKIDFTLPEPLLLPPKTSVVATGWPVNVNPDPDAVIPTIFGDKHFNVTQTASVLVGDGFAAPAMYYFQNNVPFEIHVAELEGEEFNCPASAASIINGTLPTNGTITATTTVASSTTILTTTTAPATTAEPTTTTEPTTTNAPPPPATTTTKAPTLTTTTVTPLASSSQA